MVVTNRSYTLPYTLSHYSIVISGTDAAREWYCNSSTGSTFTVASNASGTVGGRAILVGYI